MKTKAKREGDVAIEAVQRALNLSKKSQDENGGYGYDDEIAALEYALRQVRTAIRGHRIRETRARKAAKR